MKPNNLLISPTGHLKLADFGLARELALPATRMTNQVITRWYRPPELLLGARYYSSAVDMWSIGCIFAEVMLRTPYLPGESDLDQIEIICKARGTPSVADWPGLTSLPLHHTLTSVVHPRPNHAQLFSAAPKGAVQLLDLLLAYSPQRRISCTRALQHPYFSSAPRPTSPEQLPRHAKKDEEIAQGLLSDSREKNAKREGAQKGLGGSTAVESGAGVAGPGAYGKRKAGESNGGLAAAAGGKGRSAVTKEMIEERRRIARKMAFG